MQPFHPSDDIPGTPVRSSYLTPEQVFQEFAPRVYPLAFRMLGESESASLATRAALLEIALLPAHSLGETEVRRVVVNVVLTYRRRFTARRREAPVDFLPMPDHQVEGANPDRRSATKELQSQVERAIARLPESCRDVFVLADVERLPDSEVGFLLGLDFDRTRSRLHRARLLMRNALAPYLRA